MGHTVTTSPAAANGPISIRYNSVSIPIPWAVAGPHGQLAILYVPLTNPDEKLWGGGDYCHGSQQQNFQNRWDSHKDYTDDFSGYNFELKSRKMADEELTQITVLATNTLNGSNTTELWNEKEYIEAYLGTKRSVGLPEAIVLTIIYCLIFISGVIGNFCTCIVITRNNYMHTATNYYLFSLAISDVLTLILGKWKFLVILEYLTLSVRMFMYIKFAVHSYKIMSNVRNGPYIYIWFYIWEKGTNVHILYMYYRKWSTFEFGRNFIKKRSESMKALHVSRW